MKLIVITSVLEFEKDVKKMLKTAKVKSYSYQEVKGFKESANDAHENNWFGSELNEIESVLFYAFVPKTNVAELISLIEEFNQKQETHSHIHCAVVAIEQNN